MIVVRLLTVCTAFTALAACSDGGDGSGSSKPAGTDLAEFRAAFEATRGGRPLSDPEFDELVDLARDTCRDDSDVFALTYARLLDEPTPGLADGYRLQVRYFCPDRLDELDEVDDL